VAGELMLRVPGKLICCGAAVYVFYGNACKVFGNIRPGGGAVIVLVFFIAGSKCCGGKE